MGWSLVLDIVLVLVFIGADRQRLARAGLLRTAAGLVGLIAGAIASYFVMPWVAALVPSPEWRAPAAIVSALVLLGLGAWLGAVVGRALRSGARRREARRARPRPRRDRQPARHRLRRRARRARASRRWACPCSHPRSPGRACCRRLDAVTPAPDAVAARRAAHRRARRGDPLARRRARRAGRSPARLPTGDGRQRRARRGIAASVVRVTGNAFECGSNLSGSGFVVAPDRDRHERARRRGRRPSRSSRRPGSRRSRGASSRSIAENDLALIAVDGLATPPLAIDDARRRRRRRGRAATRSAARSSCGRRASCRAARSRSRPTAATSTRDDHDALGRRRPRQLGRTRADPRRRGRRRRVRALGVGRQRRLRDPGLDARRRSPTRRPRSTRPSTRGRACGSSWDSRADARSVGAEPLEADAPTELPLLARVEPAQAALGVERLGRRGHRLDRDGDVARLRRGTCASCRPARTRTRRRPRSRRCARRAP